MGHSSSWGLLPFSFTLMLLSTTFSSCHPTGSQKLHLFHSCTFYNSNSVELSGWATLEDIVFAALQKYTREIIYLQPWVSPALPADEWENLQNMFRIYLYNYIQILQDKARLYQIPCEYWVILLFLLKWQGRYHDQAVVFPG